MSVSRNRPLLRSIISNCAGKMRCRICTTGRVEADRKSLELTRALVETGIDSAEDVAQAEVTLENAEAAGIGIAANRALYEHAMATLIGKPASSFSMPVKNLTTPVPAIPVGVPSQLLQRRPGYCRRGTHHGAGECTDRNREGRVLSDT